MADDDLRISDRSHRIRQTGITGSTFGRRSSAGVELLARVECRVFPMATGAWRTATLVGNGTARRGL